MALGTVIRSFAAPATVPRGITWSGKYLWVSDQGGVDAIYQYDPATGTIIRSFAAPASGVAGLTWDGRTLWLSIPLENTIYQIDPVTGITLRSFASPSTSPQGLAWDGQTLWHTDAATGLVYQIDPETGTAIRSFAAPAATALGLAWDGHSLWISSSFSNMIYQVDPMTGTVIRSAATPSTGPAGLTWDGYRLWLCDSQTDLIYQLSVSSEAEYAQLVKSTAPIAYWPQWEPSGVISADISGNLRHGAYTGVDLGWEGIGDGATCPRFDGINDYNNIFTAGLDAAFDGSEGSLMIWMNPSATGVWTDGAVRTIVGMREDANNFIRIDKSNVNNRIGFIYNAGGVVLQRVVDGLATAVFRNFLLTWSATDDEVIAYMNGVQQGIIMTVLGVWAAGGLDNTRTVIGANSTVPANVTDGFLAHTAVWDRALLPAEVADLAVVP